MTTYTAYDIALYGAKCGRNALDSVSLEILEAVIQLRESGRTTFTLNEVCDILHQMGAEFDYNADGGDLLIQQHLTGEDDIFNYVPAIEIPTLRSEAAHKQQIAARHDGAAAILRRLEDTAFLAPDAGAPFTDYTLRPGVDYADTVLGDDTCDCDVCEAARRKG